MKKTVYKISNKRLSGLTIALVSDLHGGDPKSVIECLRAQVPDYILLPGDIFERLDGRNTRVYQNGLTMLREASSIAPTFYVTGNHEDGGTHSGRIRSGATVIERKYDETSLVEIKNSGVSYLENSFVIRDEIAFGGLLSGVINEGSIPDLSMLEDFCRLDMPKVLLCHHPEYYERYLKDRDIDLVVSGHAHGGQWRFFGRGVYAPGQGLFPKYTYGVHDNRLVVSTGLKVSMIPRFFNPTEVVYIEFE